MGHKSIAIPVTYNAGDDIRFMTVRDTRFKDWTFVTGGCRKREVANPIRCALRELSEESRGCFRIYEGEYVKFSFQTVVNTEMCTYNVFIFRVDLQDADLSNVVANFDSAMQKTDERKRRGLTYRIAQDENDAMSWDTPIDLKKKKVWDIARRVSESVVFKAISRKDPSVNWKPFSPSIVYGQ